MTTRRSKRWDGTLTSLAVDYLKEVVEKMDAYGKTVQFEFPGHAKTPIYQVINHRGFKMGFDGKHLLQAKFSGKVMVAPAAPITRARKSAGARVQKAQIALEQIERDKYNYFRENRDWLPDDIQYYADDISAMMRSGKSAEAAFEYILNEYYE